MKKILITICIMLLGLPIFGQPLLLKQLNGIGSCFSIKSILVDYTAEKTYLNVAIHKDYLTFQKNKGKIADVQQYTLDTIIDLRNNMVDYLVYYVPFFKTATLTNVADLPAPPDTIWCDISKAPVLYNGDSISRKIGIYSFADNSLAKTCNLSGIVLHYVNGALLDNYTQEINWSVDNTENVQVEGNPMPMYDYFKFIQAMYHWSTIQTVQYGVKFADPVKINDRLKY